MISRYRYIFFILIGLMLSSQAMAQHSLEKFGKNRVQYRQFKWRYYSSQNFDVYYYGTGQPTAKLALDYLDKAYDRITDMIGYAPYSKTKIFIYSSYIDYKQSNVGLKEKTYDIGGQTNFMKNYLEVVYPGKIDGFKEDLVYKVSKLYIQDMLFGGLITEVFQSTNLFTLPDWFIDGAASYIAYGWDVKMDDYARDLFKHDNYRKVKNFKGEKARIAGQSIWNFIAEKYGVINISNILNLTRIIRNEDKSVSNTLGVDYDIFLASWHLFYTRMAASTEEYYQPLPDKSQRIEKNRKESVLQHVTISPNGKYVAYTLNNQGRFKVKLRNLSNGKEKTIYKGGIKEEQRQFNKNMPVIDWGDSVTLGVIDPVRGVNILHMVNVRTGKSERKDLRQFEQIRGMDIFPNNKVMVISADVRGQNDIYLVSLLRYGVKKITNDVFDDIDPIFIPTAKQIVFSSNRATDTISPKFTYKKLSPHFNLFLYDIDTTRNVLGQLTNQTGRNDHPQVTKDGEIYFLSNSSGISNLYRLKLKDSLRQQITRFENGIHNFSIGPDNTMVFTATQDGAEKLFELPNVSSIQPVYTPSTARNQVMIARDFKAKRIEREKKDNLAWLKKEQDSVVDSVKVEKVNPEDTTASGLINVDNLSFESDTTYTGNRPENSSLLQNLRKLRKEPSISGPYPYEAKFVSDNVITSWVIDPIIGFAPLMEYQMNDLLENHRFLGGFMVGTDFNSGKIFGEYQYLSRLLDYKARFERKVYAVTPSQSVGKQKYSYNQFEVGVSYPFNDRLRLSFTPHLTFVKFADADPNLLSPNVTPKKNPLSQYTLLGTDISLVYDNSNVFGVNLHEGFKGKMELKNYTDISGTNLGFNQFKIDLRYYQPIHRQITFNTHFYYGNFFGPNPPEYLLGGVDNWLIKRTYDDQSSDPLRVSSAFRDSFTNTNILFHEFATPLRGFSYNTFNGSQVALFNAELHIPLFLYLSNGRVSSNFLRNFQLVGFYDIGTSWSSGTPFDRENSINKQVITQSPFKIVLNNFKNPWLSSYGAGVRTVLFGYYLKLDYAYPIEDYKVGSPKFSLSLGYDF